MEVGNLDHTFEKRDSVVLAREGNGLKEIFLGCADSSSFVIGLKKAAHRED